MNGGSDYASRVAWAQAQYQASKNTYMAAGVPFDKLKDWSWAQPSGERPPITVEAEGIFIQPRWARG